MLRASAAIPGLFPPVMLDVNIDGQRYQEIMSMAERRQAFSIRRL